MDLLTNITIGLDTALGAQNLMYCFLGVTLGMLFGATPGIGVLAAISLLFPLTFYLDPVTALIMLAGIWYGTTYGGRIAAILLNLPGDTTNAVTCLDGYPMARSGQAGKALFVTAIASMFGSSFGIVLMMLFTPVIASYALSFGAPEYFALMVLGLVAASSISGGSAAKGLAMIVLGIMLGTVGLDMYTGTARFMFGSMNLSDGLSLVAMAMGVFGLAEIVSSVGRVKAHGITSDSLKLRAMWPGREDWRAIWRPLLRGASTGSFFGTLPGTGPTIAAFVSYATEKRLARDPSRFGQGAIEGISAPEAANNSADQTAFIPTLSLGIPGSPSMALMLGALMVHGISPGPSLVTGQPELFWGLVMSFWIGNLMLLVLNVPLIGLWVRVLSIPYRFLFPAILVFVCIGTYTISNNPFDVWQVLCFGLLGYVMRLFDWPAAPLLLGFVLGPMMEEHFRRSMLLSRGDPMIFLSHPIAAVVLALACAILVWSMLRGTREMARRRSPRREAAQPTPQDS